MEIKIDEDIYNKMPQEIKDCFISLQNKSRECVLGLFPETKPRKPAIRISAKGKSTIYGDFGSNPITRFERGDSGSAARFFYSAKASPSERNAGLNGFESKEVIRQGLAGEHNNPLHKNIHPTVKPLALMRYLIQLITPSNGIVLDPFMGSGTTGKMALLHNRKFIGVELSQEYVNIAKARIAHHANL